MPDFMGAAPRLAHFLGLVLAILWGGFQGRGCRGFSFVHILLRLPGTVLHETAHFVVALLTGGRPTGFTIIPRRAAGSASDGTTQQVWVLGSVTISNPSLVAAFPSGLAPLLLLPLAWYLYRAWFVWFPPDLPHTLYLYGAVAVCCSSAIPSSRDWAVAFSRPLGVLLYLALGAGFWLLTAGI